MRPKIYDFNKISREIKHESIGKYFHITDYFQYYTTGIENITNNNELYIETERYDNERTDILSWEFYLNENYSDLLLAINNDVYLWDSPVDYDTIDIIVNQQLLYIQKIQNKIFNDQEKEYWTNKIKNKVIQNNDYKRKILMVSDGDKNKITRQIKDIFKSREVK